MPRLQTIERSASHGTRGRSHHSTATEAGQHLPSSPRRRVAWRTAAWALAGLLLVVGIGFGTHAILSRGLATLMTGYLASMRDGASRAVADECERHQQVALHVAADPWAIRLFELPEGARRELTRMARQLAVDEVILVRPDGRIIPEVAGRSPLVSSEVMAALVAVRDRRATLPVVLDQLRLAVDSADSQPLPILSASAPAPQGRGWVLARSAADPLFTRLLSAARPGATGETYVFDHQGLLLSRSRFEAELVSRNLLLAGPAGSTSAMRVLLRDPGTGDQPIATRPLTVMAAQALTHGTGMSITPYHDYRGQDVVGAWDWLPEHGMGLAVEMDRVEAFSAVHELDELFFSMLLLLAIAMLGMVGWYRRAALQRARALQAERRVRELGQYQLLDQIGEGGMGRVYRAKHRLLRRPTAIKLLLPQHSRPEDLARFEREANLTASLTSPHTVRIFDFGQTSAGELYIVMELLTGLDLTKMVVRYGPQPEVRVVHWLIQACDSLAEAHAQDLIHRDLKPQNLFVSRQGLHCDVLKLLDFGLAKQRHPEVAPQVALVDPEKFVTGIGQVAGTPGFMSPEQALGMPIDARTDLYALGCCVYWLLTGTQVFPYDQGQSSVYKHVHIQPESSRRRLPSAGISREMDDLIMDLLAKHPEDRVPSALDLAQRLRALSSYGCWTDADAAAWWDARLTSAASDRRPVVGYAPDAVSGTVEVMA